MISNQFICIVLRYQLEHQSGLYTVLRHQSELYNVLVLLSALYSVLVLLSVLCTVLGLQIRHQPGLEAMR